MKINSPINSIEAKEAISLLTSNMRVVTAMAACEPRTFFENIGEHAQNLEGLKVFCANPTKVYPCFEMPIGNHLTFSLMFLTSALRKLQGNDLIHYVPQHLSQWSRNIAKEAVDVFWGSCSPPDERGFVSLGPSACYEQEVLRKAKLVILEVNPHIPVTFGSTYVPVTLVDYFIKTDHLLPQLARQQPDAIDYQIGQIIADLIPDGATLQLGIGGIPNALGKSLLSKRGLGIHTEMINDTMMELFEAGVLTGEQKTLWPSKIVGAFAYGSSSLYKFIHQNPGVELQPASIVNNPRLIAKNHKMFSINTAIEIDLTGQVCSESVGHCELSGVGGAYETHTGAQQSPGGMGIIAIRSLCKDNVHSKIVFELKPGAKVSISRNDVDTVVTEYGVARLSGKTVAERVRSLISVAHPSVRETLSAQAKEFHYL